MSKLFEFVSAFVFPSGSSRRWPTAPSRMTGPTPHTAAPPSHPAPLYLGEGTARVTNHRSKVSPAFIFGSLSLLRWPYLCLIITLNHSKLTPMDPICLILTLNHSKLTPMDLPLCLILTLNHSKLTPMDLPLPHTHTESLLILNPQLTKKCKSLICKSHIYCVVPGLYWTVIRL